MKPRRGKSFLLSAVGIRRYIRCFSFQVGGRRWLLGFTFCFLAVVCFLFFFLKTAKFFLNGSRIHRTCSSWSLYSHFSAVVASSSRFVERHVTLRRLIPAHGQSGTCQEQNAASSINRHSTLRIDPDSTRNGRLWMAFYHDTYTHLACYTLFALPGLVEISTWALSRCSSQPSDAIPPFFLHLAYAICVGGIGVLFSFHLDGTLDPSALFRVF
jgi:hypothetical protein